MRILLIGDPDDVRLAQHGRLLAEAGFHVHLATSRLDRSAMTLDPRLKVHSSPASEVHASLRSRRAPPLMSKRQIIRRLHLAAARMSCRMVEVTRTLVGIDIDPGPFALRPPVWVPGAVPWPEIDVSWLARLIERLKPDAVTSFNLVPYGVLMETVRHHNPGITTPWVSVFADMDVERVEHGRDLAALEAVLPEVDALLVEREQELELARSHGLRGDRAHVGSVCGGWRLSECRSLRQQGPTSSRRIIAVAGSRGMSGRPFVALRALQLAADALQGYTIVVHSPGEGVEIAADLLAIRSGLPIELMSSRRNGDLLRMHGRARCSLALQTSERIDRSLLDAIAMASVPVGSITCRADGRIRDGVTGLLVNPEDPPSVAAAVRRVITDDAFVDRAATEGAAMAARFSREVVGEHMLGLYRHIAGRPDNT